MNITILGTGAFGLALAIAFHENHNHICMWTKFEEEKQLLEKERCYQKVLPGISLPDEIYFTTSMKKAIINADLIILCVPTCVINDVCLQMKPFLKGTEHFMIASKGLDNISFLFLDTLLQKHVMTDKVAVLSGPSFAIDLASKNPTALTIAAHNKNTIEIIKKTLEGSFIKLSVTEDVLSVEICGSIKNVMAIGSGIIEGMNFPISTQAMYITDALHDISILIQKLGGDEKTILSYAGIGDLFLTCTSVKSRNFQLGYLIGSGASKEEIQNYQTETTVEGVDTLDAFYHLMQKKDIKIPILDLLYEILFKGSDKQLFYTYLKNRNKKQ